MQEFHGLRETQKVLLNFRTKAEHDLGHVLLLIGATSSSVSLLWFAGLRLVVSYEFGGLGTWMKIDSDGFFIKACLTMMVSTSTLLWFYTCGSLSPLEWKITGAAGMVFLGLQACHVLLLPVERVSLDDAYQTAADHLEKVTSVLPQVLKDGLPPGPASDGLTFFKLLFIIEAIVVSVWIVFILSLLINRHKWVIIRKSIWDLHVIYDHWNVDIFRDVPGFDKSEVDGFQQVSLRLKHRIPLLLDPECVYFGSVDSAGYPHGIGCWETKRLGDLSIRVLGNWDHGTPIFPSSIDRGTRQYTVSLPNEIAEKSNLFSWESLRTGLKKF